MRKLLAAFFSIAIAAPASAGSLTIAAVTSAGTLTQSVTMSDADVGRVLAAYKALYGQICDNSTPPVCRARTNAETFAAFATGIFSGIKANVQNVESAAAAATATAAVQPVTMQ